MLYAVPFAAFFSALLLGHLAMRAGRPDVVGGLGAALVGLAFWAVWREAMTVGLDVLLYTLLIWGAVLPALLALALGTFVGWLEERAATA